MRKQQTPFPTSATRKRTPNPGYKPLYQQAYNLLAARIHKGAWRPSEALPSEQALAVELGVSHGTVRKALNALEADQLIERRQGKGTFVVEQTAERALFQFFRICDAGGERVAPSSADASAVRRAPTNLERDRLRLQAGEDVFAIDRLRLIDGAPAVQESIVVSAKRFPNLDQHAPLPNAIYVLYQKSYGFLVAEAREQIRAVSATAADAAILGVAQYAPLLEITRLAVNHEHMPLELRISRLSTENLRYCVTVK